MKKKFLNSSMNAIKKYYPEYDEEKLEIIEYGLEGIYLTVTKLIIIYSLAYFLDILLETFLVSLTYNLIRFTAFGMHAKKSWHCLIISSTMFIGGVYICEYVFIPFILKVILALICIILVFKFAPADTEKRPIINKNPIIFKISSTFTDTGFFLIPSII